MHYPDHPYLRIGVGGAGCAMATAVQADVGDRLAYIHSVDDLALHQTAGIDRAAIALPTRRAGMRGAEDARECAEEACADLKELLSGMTLVFLFGGLGGAVGSGALPVVARLARELELEVIGVVTLPIEFDTSAARVAEKVVAPLRATCTALIIHDHARPNRACGTAKLDRAGLLALAIAAAIGQVRSYVGVAALNHA